jgi:hypothetical protein
MLTKVVAFALLIVYSAALDINSTLIGQWKDGSVSGQDYNTDTGSWGDISGSGSSLAISNGRFVEASLLQSSLYGCPFSLFLYQRGRVDVESANVIRLSPIRGGSRRVEDSCNGRDDKDEYAQHRLYQWEVKQDEFIPTRTYITLTPMDEKTGSGKYTLDYKGDVADDMTFDISGALPKVDFDPDTATLIIDGTDGSSTNSSSPGSATGSRSGVEKNAVHALVLALLAAVLCLIL